MRNNPGPYKLFKDQQGAVMILVTLAVFALIGFAALAVDVGHLFVVRNELKNAADAGALAGARVLYNEAGTAVNEGADLAAFGAATANRSENSAVEVNLAAAPPDVQRGHWSFETRTFTPNNSLAPVDLWNVSTYELDTNTNFINAVRVQARREAIPAASFFARVFGLENFILRSESVAYIGFVGSTLPDEVDQPFAICREAIMSGNVYTCHTGRMINSGNAQGQNPTSQNSGAWTNYSQPAICQGSASAQTIRPYAGCGGNPAPDLIFGDPLQVTNGMVQNVYDRIYDCWRRESGNGIRPWLLTLPVITCGADRSPSGCFELRGAVRVNVLWMTRTGTAYSDVPRNMEGINGGADFSCPTGSTNEACWNLFRAHFNLRDRDNNLVPYEKKTLYFAPECDYGERNGTPGGENFGILAKIPVLVR